MDLLAGSINTEYGVFRNECCGDEYVLYRGIKFPNCKKHRDIVTRWHLVFPISMGPLQGPESGGKNRNDGGSAA